MARLKLENCGVDELRGVFDLKGTLRGIVGADRTLQPLPPFIRKNAWLSKCPGGRLTTLGNGADHTSAYEFALEAVPCYVRVGILNNVTADLVNVKAQIQFSAESGVLSDAAKLTALNSAARVNLTINAVSPFTVAAGNAANSVDNPSITWTDGAVIIPPAVTDGGICPAVAQLRIEIPAAGNANRPAWYFTDLGELENTGSATVAPFGRFFRSRIQAVQGVTNRALFTSLAANGQGVPFVFQYIPLYQVRGASFAMLTDSMYEGVNPGATARRVSWWGRLQAKLSTPDRPLEICNLAIHGSAPSRTALRAQNLITAIKPEFLAYGIGTINGATLGGNAAQALTDMAAIRGNMAAMKSWLHDLNVFQFPSTWMPSNNAARNAVEVDKLRIPYNAELMDAPLSMRERPMDFSSLVSGPIDGTGQTTIKAGYTDDGLHDNDVMAEVLATHAAEVVGSVFLAAV